MVTYWTVSLLNTAGIPFISQPIQYTVIDDFDPLNPVFNLTCISHNGPTTTVIWTRDGHRVPYDSNHVLSQTVTNMLYATYENVLTVKGSQPGRYQCCVSNVRGRACSQAFIFKGKAFSNA